MASGSNPLFDQLSQPADLDPAEAECGVMKDMLSAGSLFGIIAGIVVLLILPDALPIAFAAAGVGAICGASLGWHEPESTAGNPRKNRPHRRTHLTL